MVTKRQQSKDYKIIIETITLGEGVCKTGISFPLGVLVSLDQVKLHHSNKEVDCFARPLSFWQDGSIKWISLVFFRSAHDLGEYELVISSTPSALKQSTELQSGFKVQDSNDVLTITTSAFQFLIDVKTLSLKANTINDKTQLFQLESLSGAVSLGKNQKATCKLNHWNSRSFQNLSGGTNNAIELELEGHFEYQTDKQPLQFKTTIEIYQSFPFVKIETTLHNPNPAKHQGGLWDLGDENSILFDAFVFDLELDENNTITYQTSPGSSKQTAEAETEIIQQASGGKNWQSPVHVDKNNQVTLDSNGFKVLGNKVEIDRGDRATPIVYSSNGVGLTVEKFWQNFPTSLKISDNHIQVGFFPSIANSFHELQGGEKKTHTFWLSLSNHASIDWIHSPPIAKQSLDWLVKCQTLLTCTASTERDSIATLIESGLTHKQDFFTKRETLDEYGWRNFGDLYADHETAGYEGKELFVSHYNNQYDPIYGLLRQFLLTGDPRWFELADDLAQHVKDIDIYHTVDDKADFNGGLFWHTAHYLTAHASTHRSYSLFHDGGAYEDVEHGGGPAGQHCYTTGLTYHYLLTGTEDSKLAVLTLANWVTCVYEGAGTCLDLAVAFKNRNASHLKNQFTGQYPFDRGTGNYIVALLDCYQLTQDKEYLLRVEQIIQNTIHPTDDVNERDLPNIELSWFYTILLQAICRYLETKEAINEFDDAFYYARDAILHYANWMLAHEYPYLDKPDILEFPNDTWAAQELRKPHVLAAAYYYSPDNENNKQAYLDKAQYFQEYVSTHLSASEELSYTRILVLLMQSHGPLEYFITKNKTTDFAKPKHNWALANYHRTPNLAFSVIKELGKRLLKLSITKEINWLKKRLGK